MERVGSGDQYEVERFEALEREQAEVIAEIRDRPVPFSASDRVAREQAHDRQPNRTDARTDSTRDTAG